MDSRFRGNGCDIADATMVRFLFHMIVPAEKSDRRLMRQMFGAMPGMGDYAGKMADEITKGGNVTLGMHMGVFMPGLAKIMEQARASGATVPDLPPGDQPLAEVNLNLKELSTDKVPDEVFVIPAGYKEAPAEDLVKGMMAAFTGGKQ